MNSRPKETRRVRRWHRLSGLTAAAFLLVFAVSGILVNHGNALGLDRIHVSWPALLDWYGIPSAEVRMAFTAGGHRYIQADEHVYRDTGDLLIRGELVGGVSVDGLTVLAMRNRLLLLTQDGELVESLAADFAGPVSALGSTGGRIVIRADAGIHVSDDAMVTWRQTGAPEGTEWSRSEPVPAAVAHRITKAERGRRLSAERLLLDIHSGRILGLGAWFGDLVALLLIGLALTGTAMRRRRSRQKP